jgi:hypothetical protein
MADNSSMSIATAAQHAKQNPNDAADAIQTLFEYVDEGGTEASDAAKSLSTIAKRVPAAFDGQTANFEQALGTADGVHTRRNLAEAVNNLIEQHAIPPEDAGRALTEATRIRDDEYWEARPKRELLNIRKGLDGWTDVADMSEPVPEIVVERALELADIGNHIGDLTTLIAILDLLQAAVESGSPLMERAFQAIIVLAKGDDQTLTSEATIAVAELVVSGDIPDEDAARDVITSNADAVRRKNQIVVHAREEIIS